MATWRIWPALSGGAVTADAAAYSLSVEFTVTQSGCNFTGYWWWCPASGNTAAKGFSLWSVTTGTTGTQISAANATSGTLTAGAWNFTACTPTALTSGTHYRAEVTYAGGANWYGPILSYFTSGAGASNIVQGPLTCFSNANATGTIQGGYVAGTGTALFTTGAAGGGAWYGIDVQVDDGITLAPPSLLPVRPGRTWRCRFKHRQQPQLQPPPPPVTITGTAVAAGAGAARAGTVGNPAIPGQAIPGRFTPGSTGARTGCWCWRRPP